jgi:hypothetical protein
MVCPYGLFRVDFVIDDSTKHFDEGKGVLGEVDLSAEESHTRAVFLRVGYQPEGVVSGASASSKNADDQLRIVTSQFR